MVRYHEHPGHQDETKLYLSIFALLRMIIFLVYLIQGNHFEQVLDYLYTNWFEMVKPLKTSDYKKQESGDDLDQPSVLYHIDNDNQQD